MDSYRRQAIEAKATELLRDAGVDSLPVDPKRLAKHLEISVEAKPPKITGASGWLIRSGEEFAIVYATHIASPGFQHFCIAHELGHYWLEGHPEHVFRNGTEHASHAGFGSGDEIEREADYFAACLLMPKRLCSPLIGRSQDGLAAVLKLADTCGTSLTAAALRYAEIGRLPVGILQCLHGKVEFCAAYPLQEHVGWARPLPRNAKVPAESATQRLANDVAGILSAQQDSDSTEACDWFPGADRNASLVEEVIGLGKFSRTLTVLTLDLSEANDDEDEESEADKDSGPIWAEPRFR